MYYKVSNNYKVNDIELETGLRFRFPEVYKSSKIIDGLNEELLPVITSQNQHHIDFGIWGILPQNFRDEWVDFQKIRNTLNVDIRSIDSESDYQESLSSRRCVVIVSGFFASYNFRGQIYPIYLYPNEAKVFYLAAIYNVTDDGFISFTILLEKSNYDLSKFQNISDSMPIILDNDARDTWLNDNYDTIVSGENDSYNKLNFSSHTISKEFYKNNILYDSILEPVTYKELIKT